MDVYGAREDPVPGVTGAMVADAVPLPAERVLFEPSWSAAAPALAARARPGDLVMTMGAGDVSMVGPEVLEVLRERHRNGRRRSRRGQPWAGSDEPHGYHDAGPHRRSPPDAGAASAGAGDAAGPPSPAGPAPARGAGSCCGWVLRCCC